MDSQDGQFAELVDAQLSYLNSNSEICHSTLIREYERIDAQRQKLNGFADSILATLAIPRLSIVVDRLGKSARRQTTDRAVALLVEPSADFPSEATFRVDYEIFIPTETIVFDYEFRISTNRASHSNDNWFRFTIPSFGQTDFCDWFENAIVDFIDTFVSRSRGV